jgi:hypothetical protein
MSDGREGSPRAARVLELFQAGYNCAQAVLAAYGPDLSAWSPSSASRWPAGLAAGSPERRRRVARSPAL